MWPRVTGSRLSTKNASQVRLAKSAGTRSALAHKAGPAASLMSRPSGIMNMLATECSKPAATNKAIGIVTARILSVVVRPEYAAQIAKHTMRLHSTPRTKASRNEWLTFPREVVSTTAPHAPSALRQVPPKKMKAPIVIAPMKLAT